MTTRDFVYVDEAFVDTAAGLEPIFLGSPSRQRRGHPSDRNDSDDIVKEVDA